MANYIMSARQIKHAHTHKLVRNSILPKVELVKTSSMHANILLFSSKNRFLKNATLFQQLNYYIPYIDVLCCWCPLATVAVA